MAFLTKSLTLTGVPQNLESGGPTITAAQNALSIPARLIKFQGGDANPVYIGDSAAVSAVNYGTVLASSTDTEDFYNANVKLADFWVLGTVGSILHVSVVPY